MNKIMLKVVRSSVVLAFGALCLTTPIDTDYAKLNNSIVEAATSQTAVVTGSYVNLRSGPGTNHATQGQVKRGDRLPVLSKQGDWYQIKKSDGQSAWLAGWLVRVESTPVSTPPSSPITITPTPAPAPTTTETAVVTGTYVNLRSGPGTSYALAGQVKQGDKLPVLAKQGDWLKLKKSDGKEVWIAGWLAKVEQSTVATPAPAPIPTPTPAPAPTTTVTETAVVTGTYVNLRSGPGTSYALAGQVKQGDKLPVLAKQGDWLKLKKSDGKEVWMAGWLAKVERTTVATPAPAPIPTPTPAPATTTTETAVVTGTYVNLRSGPGTSYALAGQVNQGDKLPVLAKQGDWLKLKKSDGKEVWMAGWLARVETVVATVPQPTTKPTNPQPTTPAPTPSDIPSRGGDIDRDQVAWLPTDQTEEPDKVVEKDDDREEDKEYDGPQLKDIEVEEDDDKTIITVEADTKLQYNTFMLTNPNRLVINFEGVHLGDVPKSQKVRSSTVEEFRTGQFSSEPMIARMVLDLSETISYRINTSKQGKVVEIEVSEVKYNDAVEGKVIFIDAGHGGNDPGAPGYSRSTWEEHANLDMALKLAALLKQQGAVVEMSRTSDKAVDLHERPQMANRLNSDIFVSIHSNANNNSSMQGTSVYFYAPYSRADLYEQRSDRQRLAQNIQNEMVQHATLQDKKIREANFAVLRESKMPSVLVETAFISNPEEERRLADPNFRQQVAEAIARGINAYFSGK